MKYYIAALIKFTDHPCDFLGGNLYCHNINYFREMEFKQIHRQYEGTALSKKKNNIEINFVITDPFPAFCMYSVEVKSQNKPHIQITDERLKKFGKYAVIVTDVKEFLKRINQYQPKFLYQSVRYINYDDQEKKSILNYEPITIKYDYFRYEHEFRIFSYKYLLLKETLDKIP
ncbi:MAG: hypothetical protein ABSA76_14845, partial [Bacteroidales bacterium]